MRIAERADSDIANISQLHSSCSSAIKPSARHQGGRNDGVPVFKRALFQIHWFLGITAGIVLAVMGITGASISFEDEITEALSPRLFAPGAPAAPDLTPDQLIAKVQADHPGYYVSRLDWQMDRDLSHGVRMSPNEGRGRLEGQVDRATGAWLGEPAGAGFFHLMDQLHRWLALPGGGNGIGRQITAFSAISLIFFALSGLYLRWPRQALDWRAWFVLDLRKTGRNLWRALHVVIGTWVLLFYLLSALTGLWWSYDWYRQGVVYALTGKAPGEEAQRGERKKDGIAPRPAIDPSWHAFRRSTDDRYVWVRLTQPAPSQPVKTISFDAREADARHLRQTDRFSYDPKTAKLKKSDLYDRRPLGVIITQSVLELHRGAFFGMPGRIALMLTSLTMPLFTVTGFLLYLSRRRRKKEAKALDVVDVSTLVGGPEEWLVAYASQTGTAEIRARNAALALGKGGIRSRVLPVGKLTSAMLAEARHLLIVVSTYGEGEPPDMARGFTSRLMRGPSLDLSHLHYGLLAIGDREYPDFCGYGIAVDDWLRRSGAVPLFTMIKMDHIDAEAEHAWHDALHGVGAADATRGQTALSFAAWRLVSRTALNPDSEALPAFHLQFEPSAEASPLWKAGDIVEVQPHNAPQAVDAMIAAHSSDGELIEAREELRAHYAGVILPDSPATISMDHARSLRPLPAREYSAASITADGTLDLVVRQVRRDDGGLGIGSGWLTAHMPVGSETLMRLRPNPGFRMEEDNDSVAMILIGNGTGIAGLRAHLKEQAQAGNKGHWLLFGERQRAHESFFDEELQRWMNDGTLARLDRSFSRDADCGRYVQDLLSDKADIVRDWIDRGAIILVCGSLDGMAQGVHDALSAALGESLLENLAENGRYKRDVY